MTKNDSKDEIIDITKEIRNADVEIKKLESNLADLFDEEIKTERNVSLRTIRTKSVVRTMLINVPLLIIPFAFLASPWIYNRSFKKIAKQEMIKSAPEFTEKNKNLSFWITKKKKLEEQKRQLRGKEAKAIAKEKEIEETADFIKKLRSCGLSDDQIHDIGRSYNYKFPFFGASEEELMEFQGIGKKKAKLLKQCGF